MSHPLRYKRQELQQHLARTYVVGALRGLARRRFERLMMELPELRQRVLQWQDHLQPMADAVPVEIPAPAVWKGIQAKITPVTEASAAASRPWGLPFLGWGLAAALLVMGALTTLLTLRPSAPVTAAVDYVAVLEDSAGTPVAVATTKIATQLLTVSILRDPELTDDADLELWAVSKTDGETRSLGLLDRNDSGEKLLTAAQTRLVKDAQSLLITVEPEGGSPIGEPGGEVFSQGVCVRILGWQADEQSG